MSNYGQCQIQLNSATAPPAIEIQWEETMKINNIQLSLAHRSKTALSALLLGTCLVSGSQAVAQTEEPFTIVINQSPWFAGFEGLVEAYTAATGNEVVLDVNPFRGALEKQRNSARAPEGDIDMFVTNVAIMAEMWDSGLVHYMEELDPDFKLSDQISTFDDTVCWDEMQDSFDCESGKLVGVPINPNVQVLYYRADLYEENGLKVPTTLAELEANAIALHNPPDIFGIVQRGSRSGVASNTRPYIYGMGGKKFADHKNGDYTVVLDSPEAKAGLQFYVDLAKKAGHPNAGAIAQGDMIQLAAAGRAAHFVAVIAAFAQLENPDKSIVAGKFNVAVVPGNPPSPQLGHFISSIPKNIPEAQKSAAVAFLKWFQTKEAQEIYVKAGGVPVREDVLTGELSKEEAYRWMPELWESFQYAGANFDIQQGNQLIGVMELYFNQAMTGELTVDEAIETAADEIRSVVKAAGLRGDN